MEIFYDFLDPRLQAIIAAGGAKKKRKLYRFIRPMPNLDFRTISEIADELQQEQKEKSMQEKTDTAEIYASMRKAAKEVKALCGKIQSCADRLDNIAKQPADMHVTGNNGTGKAAKIAFIDELHDEGGKWKSIIDTPAEVERRNSAIDKLRAAKEEYEKRAEYDKQTLQAREKAAKLAAEILPLMPEGVLFQGLYSKKSKGDDDQLVRGLVEIPCAVVGEGVVERRFLADYSFIVAEVTRYWQNKAEVDE